VLGTLHDSFSVSSNDVLTTLYGGGATGQVVTVDDYTGAGLEIMEKVLAPIQAT
jgi:hypothetical protein